MDYLVKIRSVQTPRNGQFSIGANITTPDGTIMNVNEAFNRITSYSRHEVLGKNPNILSSGRQDKDFYANLWHSLKEQGHWVGEVWNRRKNGEVYAVMENISVVRDNQGKTSHYIAMISDITLLKEHQSQLERIANYDVLTGLPNRALLARPPASGDATKQAQGARTGRGIC